MKIRLFFTLLITMLLLQAKAQEINSEILKTENIGKTYKSIDNDNTEVIIQYIGNVKSKSKNIYKVVNKSIIWGENSHTIGAIYIYDKDNIYIGKYILGDMFDLPYKIKNNKILFKHNKKYNQCNPKIITKINFRDEIPQDIFIKCTKNKDGLYSGDIYSLQKEKIKTK